MFTSCDRLHCDKEDFIDLLSCFPLFIEPEGNAFPCVYTIDSSKYSSWKKESGERCRAKRLFRCLAFANLKKIKTMQKITKANTVVQCLGLNGAHDMQSHSQLSLSAGSLTRESKYVQPLCATEAEKTITPLS